MGCFFIQNAWNWYVYKSWKQLRVSIIHFLLILGAFLVVCMFWAGLSYLYSLSFACDCIWCLPWVYWALAVLCVPGLCPWCGISAVWFGESFSGVLLVVALFSCHFRVAKVTSVKSLGVWDPNISAIRQQTRRGSRIVFWHFRNLILLYSQILVFLCFSFLNCSCEKLVL